MLVKTLKLNAQLFKTFTNLKAYLYKPVLN